MATILNEQATSNTASTKKAPTHFINVNIMAKGKPLKLGAIPVFADSADKVQRTLLELLKTNPEQITTLHVTLDVRENIKSTDVYESDLFDVVETVQQTTDETEQQSA